MAGRGVGRTLTVLETTNSLAFPPLSSHLIVLSTGRATLAAPDLHDNMRIPAHNSAQINSDRRDQVLLQSGLTVSWVLMSVLTVMAVMLHIKSHFLLVTRGPDTLYNTSRSTEILAGAGSRHQATITCYYFDTENILNPNHTLSHQTTHCAQT